MDSFCICYNLAQQTYPGISVLPEAYIVPIINNELGYVEKQATTTTLQSIQIPYLDTPHETLLKICADIKPSVLEQRFKPAKQRKNKGLKELLEAPDSKEIITKYIQTKLATFYQLIIANGYAITFHAQRKDPFELHRLALSKEKLLPILEFTKTSEGIEYAFTLQDGETTILPQKANIRILLNDPSYIILAGVIRQIQHLNANKLKPFFQKEKITIAPKHIKTYLDKVIIPVIKNIDVTTHGFQIETLEEIQTFGIEIIEDFMKGSFIAKAFFYYQNAHFEYHSTQKTSTSVTYEENQEIRIQQIKRNSAAETTIITQLCELGLQLTDSLFLTYKSDDPLGIFEWLQQHQSALASKRFEIRLPQFDKKTINLSPHELTFTHQKTNDWFDIKGVVTIGEKTIPFVEFMPYIKQRRRFFPIDDTEVFIIPIEWMSRFKPLTTHAHTTKDGIQVAKSKYTILQNIVSREALAIEQPAKTEYTASTTLKATLRPYQQEGVSWLLQHYHNQLGACLADDMGLGKTLQTIAILDHAKQLLTPDPSATKTVRLDLFSDPLEIRTYLKALVILPSSLIFNWAQELIKFAPHLNIVKYTGADRKKTAPYLETYDVILTTYSTVSRDVNILEKTTFHYLILDESQQIKNKESKVFKAINSLHAHHKISLSGTPIENSLADLWAQMEFINPGMLGSFHFFNEYFKLPIEKHQNPERIEELKTLIDPFILRRTKEQVAKDLPALSEQIIYTAMEPAQAKTYEKLKSAARNALLGLDPATTDTLRIINTLTQLRQVANHPVLANTSDDSTSGKFNDVTAYLDTLIKSQKKVLIFSSFVSHLELYQDWCAAQHIPYVTLTGKVPSEEREVIVNEFQSNPTIPLFFISLKAGGVGLNLTKASYVVILDPWWNPFIEKQAIARAHRIGQQQRVTVSRFISLNTIEEKIIKLQQKKKELSDSFITTDRIPEYITTELNELLS